MHFYSTLILFPKCDDYSSIHEWPLFTELNALSDCTLHPYNSNRNCIDIMHHHANTQSPCVILVFGTEQQWQFLQTALAHHPHCVIQEPSTPYAFYARMNGSTHILGLPTTLETHTLVQKHLTTYFQTIHPQTLPMLSLQVGKQLKQNTLTISSAESCSGGLIAKTFTDIAGSSAYFNGGICTYTAEAKMHTLHVPGHILDNYGIVSEETARAMAQGAQQLFSSDIAVSTTGVAGPGPDADGNPEGLVCIGIAIGSECNTYQYHATEDTICTDRNFIRYGCVRFILETLLATLNEASL